MKQNFQKLIVVQVLKKKNPGLKKLDGLKVASMIAYCWIRPPNQVNELRTLVLHYNYCNDSLL